MANRREGYEAVEVDGSDYLFKADFAFLAELKDESEVDPMVIFSAFASGESDPLLVRAVLISSIEAVDGLPLVDSDKRVIIENMITLYGLQEAWILAQHMLSYSMIGSVKKSQLGNLEKMAQVLGGSHWMNSKNLLSRWALPLTIIGVSVCISISLSGLLIWQFME